jgi:hypothetical protein
MGGFAEQNILNALRGLLTGRVNELLGEMELPVPPVELGEYRGGAAAVPAIGISTCERTEKERIILLDAYSVSIGFSMPGTPESEVYCFAYAAAVEKALIEDPALGGAASGAVLTGKKYRPPKLSGYGEPWELILSLRVAVEGLAYAG